MQHGRSEILSRKIVQEAISTVSLRLRVTDTIDVYCDAVEYTHLSRPGVRVMSVWTFGV